MTLTYWDGRAVVSSQRLTPAFGPPGRLYSDKTFVSIRNPFIQAQRDADGLWIAPDRDRLRQRENLAEGRKDYRPAYETEAPPRKPAIPPPGQQVPEGSRPGTLRAHAPVPSGLFLLLG